jgi:hypothetical protein
MGQLIIYGASDDLIEVEGDIEEEFNPPYGSDDDASSYLAFSDGSLLSITYTDDGLWKISPISVGSKTILGIESATDIDDNYSDRVTLEGEFRWVVMGTELARAGKQ